MLTKPLFPKGFSCKYPLSSGNLDIPLVQGNQNVERKAVDVMKDALQMSSNGGNSFRKKPKILFKPRIKRNDNNAKVILNKKRKR